MFRLIVALSALCLASALSLPEPEANEGRIVNGKNADILEYPYQCSLQLGGSHFCGCSIISPEWILTAAHCLSSALSKDEVKYLNVRCGTHLWNSGGHTRKVVKAINHPEYDDVSMDMDVGLMKLDKPLIYSSMVKPVKLLTAPYPSNMDVTVSGWGHLYENANSIPQEMQQVYMKSVSQESCGKDYKYSKDEILPSMICAVGPSKDSCQGDSGGPLNIKGTRCQVGVVSWGYGCAKDGLPGSYCAINYGRTIKFIKDNVRDAEFVSKC